MRGTCSVVLGAAAFGLVVLAGPPPSPAQTPFDLMDRDGDGRLSREEFRGDPTAFRRLDRNGDGYISREEATGTPLLGSERRSPSELLYVDTHNHLVGPRRGGPSSPMDSDAPARAALAAMDSAGVKLNLVMPMPQGAEQAHHLYLNDILPVVKRYPGRFAVLGGGDTLNVLIQQAVKAGRVTEALRKEFDATAATLVSKGIVGFGEMAAEHFSMRADHPYVSAPPDHPLFLRLAELAATYDLPVDIHMDAIPEEMPLPPRLQSPPNPSTLKANMPGFERLLAHNRRARIVWAHLGWDNTGRRTVELTRWLLAAHPNLSLSVRVASGMQARGVDASTFPLDGAGRLKPDWLALFREFPDRFVMGSDEIVQGGDRHPSAGSIRATADLLRQLPPDLQRAIGYENAYRLYKLPR